MSWLARHAEIREDPTRLLKGCRTIISLAFPYDERRPETSDGYRAARYADPRKEDYHRRLKNRCGELADLIRKNHKGSRIRICIDSAPILEKGFAWTAGIGFIGKNTLLILPEHGSYVYLAEILTTAPLPIPAVRPMENGCGSRTLCLEACPTGALERPFCLNASRCLSYLTIEHKGGIGKDVARKMDRCFWGCDRFQEVCPYNKGPFPPQITMPSTGDLLKMDEAAFQERFGKTAFSRAGLQKLKSNIRAITPRGKAKPQV